MRLCKFVLFCPIKIVAGRHDIFIFHKEGRVEKKFWEPLLYTVCSIQKGTHFLESFKNILFILFWRDCTFEGLKRTTRLVSVSFEVF